MRVYSILITTLEVYNYTDTRKYIIERYIGFPIKNYPHSNDEP